MVDGAGKNLPIQDNRQRDAGRGIDRLAGQAVAAFLGNISNAKSEGIRHALQGRQSHFVRACLRVRGDLSLQCHAFRELRIGLAFRVCFPRAPIDELLDVASRSTPACLRISASFCSLRAIHGEIGEVPDTRGLPGNAGCGTGTVVVPEAKGLPGNAGCVTGAAEVPEKRLRRDCRFRDGSGRGAGCQEVLARPRNNILQFGEARSSQGLIDFDNRNPHSGPGNGRRF